MSTVTPRMSNSALVGNLPARGIDAIQQETAQARGLWQRFGSGQVDEPGQQREHSIERGFRVRGPIENEWGQSESLDPDNVGDIADEGMGHRG